MMDALQTYNANKVKINLNIEQLDDFVKDNIANVSSAYDVEELPSNLPFNLRITPSLVEGTPITKHFKQYAHFTNWLKQQDARRKEADSDGKVHSFRDVTELIDVEFSTTYGERKYNTSNIIIKQSEYYTYELLNQKDVANNNNCGLKAIEYVLKCRIQYAKEKKLLGLNVNDKLTLEQITDIYKKYNTTNKLLIIIDNTFNEKMRNEFNYLFIEDNHIYNIKKAIYKSYLDVTKRGLAFWDIEARLSDRTKKIGLNQGKVLKDILLKVHYINWSSPLGYKTKTFISDNNKFACRKFLDWITEQSKNNKHYTFIAHNCSRFDNYFLISYFTELEQLHSPLSFRGLSIIKMIYKGNIFIDSCCFLPDKLSNLCENFKVEEGKLCEFEYKGKKMTNENLCFYKGNDCDINEFLDLQNTEPEFWKMYEDYCERDCVALKNVWCKFNKNYTDLLSIMFAKDTYSQNILKLTSSTTIGSLSLKIFKQSLLVADWDNNFNVVRNEDNEIVSCKLKEGVKNTKVERQSHIRVMNFLKDDNNEFDNDKIRFVELFKRGGMSVCQLAGTHLHPTVSYDITSQYPASCMGMKIPCDKSRWVSEVIPEAYGFYHLKNCKYNCKKLRPVAINKINGKKLNSLDWCYDYAEEAFVDTFMLDRLIKKDGLVSYEVVKGLVSDKTVNGYFVFKKYVETLFKLKEQQDALKEKEDPAYNETLREVIKLFLNSLTGKFCEDYSKYTNTAYSQECNTHINGLEIGKYEDKDHKLNEFVIYSVCLYSYSKRLLFEYIDIIGPDNIIAIETDSFYFDKKYEEDFLKKLNWLQKRPSDVMISLGGKLGGVKKECDTTKPSYFFGKKIYAIEKKTKKKIYYACRLKGIPNETIDEYGNKVQIVDENKIKDLCNGIDHTFYYVSLIKELFVEEKANISSYLLSRTIEGKNLPVYI